MVVDVFSQLSRQMVEFSQIAEVLDDLRKGKMIVLVDDEDRETKATS